MTKAHQAWSLLAESLYHESAAPPVSEDQAAPAVSEDLAVPDNPAAVPAAVTVPKRAKPKKRPSQEHDSSGEEEEK